MADEPELTQADIEAMVRDTIAALPEPFASRLATGNVEIMVAERPTVHQWHRAGLGPGQTLFGLYEGIPVTQRGQGYTLIAPDVITVFSGPMLAAFRDRNTLMRHVRRTVLHELAHHWGIDDNRLHEINAY